MEEQITNKPTKGTWARLGEKDPKKIYFDVNVPVTVTFLTEEPEEIQSDLSEGQVYYRFMVEHEGMAGKYFDTSAWTLLSALKENAPLIEKKAIITKKLMKGKQGFEVKFI